MQGGTYSGFIRVYKNGVAHGAIQEITNTSYGAVISEDLTGFAPGDLVQAYLWCVDAIHGDVFIKNFRLCVYEYDGITVDLD